MSELRLAGNLIENLNLLGYGHLQLVLVDGDTQLENEVQAPFFATIPFGGDWQYPDIRNHKSVSNTSNFGVAGEYAASKLNLGDRSAEGVWEILKQVRAQFVQKGSSIDYDVSKNSNSYATSLLAVVGINVATYLAGATPSEVSSFPGVGLNIFETEEDAFSLTLVGGADNDIFHTGLKDDTLTGGAGNDLINGGAGNDVAIFSGSCLDYNMSRGADGTITVSHVRGSKTDGVDTLKGIETARFADHEVSLTGPTVVGCTELSFVQDFVVGTTQDRQVIFDLERLGDTSYAIRVFVDGQVTTGNAFFNDFYYTIQPGDNPQLVIGASVAEVFGDVAFNFFINLSIVDTIYPFVEISDGTAGGVLIGDTVDDRGGRAFGDPHLITFDNVAFDFQAAGEFVLVRATSGSPYVVQARFVPISSAISVTEAAATVVGGITVSIEANGESGSILVGGVAVTLNDGATLSVGEGWITRTGNHVEIDYGTGDFTGVDIYGSFLNVSPNPSIARAPGSLEGLLGNANGTPADEFRLADGTVLTTPVSIEKLYGEFAASWLVNEEESLLPGDYRDFAAPGRIVTLDSLPTAIRQAAEAAVDARGIANPLIREAAILDFALTGNTDFIDAAVQTDQDFNPIVDTVPIDPVSSPVVVLTSTSTTIDEGDPATRLVTFMISRGNAEGSLTATYQVTGTGASPTSVVDFNDEVLSGTVVIADGAESASFTIEVADDDSAEATENFDVSIDLGPQARDYELLISSVSFSIIDDDAPGGTGDITGDAGDNTLGGTEGDDRIFGLGGKDKLFGSAGNDLLVGGAEPDEMDGGTGIDTASYREAMSGVTANLIKSSNAPGDAYRDIFVSIENLEGSSFSDRLTGSNSENTLWGGDGDDYLSGLGDADELFGGNGNDNLSGGGGNDKLFGGKGNDNLTGGRKSGDLFIFDEFDFGEDVITDFEVGKDVVDFRGSGLTASIAEIIQTEQGAMIAFDQAGSLLLLGVTVGSVGSSDFWFS